jgi:anaerobic ribonucleoside-triphosphate reductase
MSIVKRIPVEVYSRVVGYFRPVNQWNKGKQAEFKNRHTLSFKEKNKKNKKNA